jgi:acyl-CoA synthetase (AMP-forming)/AMP-acid ligase II
MDDSVGSAEAPGGTGDDDPDPGAALTAGGACLIDVVSGHTLRGNELAGRIERQAEQLAALPEGVLLSRTAADLDGVLHYLAALRTGRAIGLIDPTAGQAALEALVARFHPAAVLAAPERTPPTGYTARDGHWVRRSAEGTAPHPDLAVLLATSGSTGSPKFVRLSRRAVLSNARAIADALGIAPTDVAVTSLPLHYSYGLSVLNSHLLRGATVVIENSGLLGEGLWDAVAEHGVTSLAGVPHHYETLHRRGFDPAHHPSLHTMTQAGGKLRTELITHFDTAMRQAGGRMFVMYGQTEAAPRMSIVPAERLAEKLGSAGPALPGGRFCIRREDGEETTHPKIVGEVVYRGPNVMMGYAETGAELARDDDMGGALDTGDLGYLDEDGYLYLTGRLKRIGTVFGNRISLDDLEHAVRAHHSGIEVVAAVPAGDKVVLFAEGVDAETCAAVSHALADRLHLHTSGFDVRGIDTVPLLRSGKIDYRTLEVLLGGERDFRDPDNSGSLSR